MTRLASVLVFLLLASPALADGYCVDAAGPRQHVADHHGKWTVLTNEQRLFMAGIYAMAPTTPPGLPYGDSAALIQFEDRPGGLVFFIDGDKACTPMPVPAQLIEMLMGLDEIHHEKAGDGT